MHGQSLKDIEGNANKNTTWGWLKKETEGFVLVAKQAFLTNFNFSSCGTGEASVYSLDVKGD